MSLLFYTAANKEYQFFTPIYIYSALKHNPEAYVEVGLADSEKYKNDNPELINILRKEYGDRFKLTSVDFKNRLPGAVRFITEPKLSEECDYVYIGDIDILILDENIENIHLAHMNENNLPFSNRIRPEHAAEGKNHRLSGLHFAPVDLQYPLPNLDDINYSSDNNISGADENVLYRIMDKKQKNIPKCINFRPEHGIHMRKGSHPFGSRRDKKAIKFSFEKIIGGEQQWAWTGIEQSEYRRQFLSILEDDLFRQMYPHLNIKMKNIILILENVCRDRYSKFEEEAYQYIISESGFERKIRILKKNTRKNGLKHTYNNFISGYVKKKLNLPPY